MSTYLFGLLRFVKYSYARCRAAIGKRQQAGYQPAAGCQPAPQGGTFHYDILRACMVLSLASGLAAAPGAVVTVRNPIDLARPAETIVLAAAELRSLLAVEAVDR